MSRKKAISLHRKCDFKADFHAENVIKTMQLLERIQDVREMVALMER